MKRRIFRRIFILYGTVLLLSLVIMEVFITGAVRETTVASLRSHLASQARLAADLFIAAAPTGITAQAGRIKELTAARVTIIARDGAVIGDSDFDRSLMENHGGRPEIQEAAIAGVGSSIRRSDTLRTDFLYVAVPILKNGARSGYLRLSMPLTEVDRAVNNLRLQLIVVIGLILIIPALFIIWKTDQTRRLTVQLREFAQALAAGKHGHRLFLPQAGEFDEIAESLNDMASTFQQEVKALQDEQAKLETALLGISDGVMLLDKAGKIVLANRAFYGMSGIEMDVTGKPFLEVIRNHALAEIVQNAHERHRPFSGDVEIAHPQRLLVHATALPIVQESLREDRYRGALLALHDITRLTTLEQARKDFVANVSHELKTPIAAIQGFAETLLGGALDDRADAERFLEIILNHSLRLRRLVDDLLILSRIERGDMNFVIQPAAVETMIGSAIALLDAQARAKRITLAREASADLPLVAADPDRIVQVLVNLLDNAVKFTPPGGMVTITSHPAADAAATGVPLSVEIVIEDSGPGIPVHLIPRLGERFFRVDPGRSRDLGGTGLGLAIVKHILRAHDSVLAIKNRERNGLQARFILPAA